MAKKMQLFIFLNERKNADTILVIGYTTEIDCHDIYSLASRILPPR